MSGRRIGVLGGTFDPIHIGHLAAAEAAQQACELDEIRFVPTHVPPHRPDNPRASGYHRLQMVSRAVSGRAGWEVSDVELGRAGPSYTFDTLTTFRAEVPGAQFFFITGADAFAGIATWRRYPVVLDLAHFVVVARTGTTFESLRTLLPDLANRFVDTSTQAVSAALDAVAAPIFLVRARTPHVSSTDIRRRAATGLPLDGLVPAAVAAYIADHHLYAPAPGA
ncbi:MAG: nicotinate-nucleotide adenylyltransferase [Acidobacteria bacterium]|nr:nicotinate-nucleotide adenylyltransferase [Acidobacteriota bacterium]